MEIEVYIPDMLEFKQLSEGTLPCLHELRFLTLDPIIVGTEKSKQLIDLANKKLKITISEV